MTASTDAPVSLPCRTAQVTAVFDDGEPSTPTTILARVSPFAVLGRCHSFRSDLTDASRIARASISRRSRTLSGRLPSMAWSALVQDFHPEARHSLSGFQRGFISESSASVT